MCGSAADFRALISLFSGTWGLQGVTPRARKDRGFVEKPPRRAVGNAVFLKVLPLRQLAAILSLLRVYVANDSGPMHIAAAVGTKTVGIFGPGEENIWFPYTPPYYDLSAGHVALRKDVPCHPCHLDFCNREGDGYMECMKLLSVTEVFEEIRKRL